MKKKPDINSLREDLTACCRNTLRGRIDNVESGEYNLQIARTKSRKMHSADTHFHANPELFLQVSGVSVKKLPDGVMYNPPQSICIIPRGVPHAERAENSEGDFLNLVISFGRRSIAIHNAVEGREKHARVYKGERFFCTNSNRVRDYLNDICDLEETENEISEKAIRGLLLSALAIILEAIEEGKNPVRDDTNPKIVRCKQLVQANLPESKLNVKFMAELLECSPDYLSHLFSTETGLSLTSYINSERVAYAQELMEDTTLNLSEIAWACGYSDPNYFSRMFKNITGNTPREFRAKQLEK